MNIFGVSRCFLKLETYLKTTAFFFFQQFAPFSTISKPISKRLDEIRLQILIGPNAVTERIKSVGETVSLHRNTRAKSLLNDGERA